MVLNEYDENVMFVQHFKFSPLFLRHRVDVKDTCSGTFVVGMTLRDGVRASSSPGTLIYDV